MKQMAQDGKEYVVFGSSIGWLAFYGAYQYHVKTVGVEIMEYLVSVSNEAKHTLAIDEVRFVHDDMLKYDLANANVVMLTSQCWDDDLIAQVYSKLALELVSGALVIDYRATLAESHSDVFEVAEKVVTKVSWNPQQPFYVFRHV